MRFDLTDEEWALLEPLMPKSRKSARVDDHKILNAIFYVLRTGMPWRDLPERYGPYTSAYNRFNRWARRGIWKHIFDQVAARSRDGLYFIDSTIIRAHRCASGGKGGRKIRRSASAAAAGRRKSMPLSIARPSSELHPHRWSGPRQPSRRRSPGHAATTLGCECGQGL